MNKDFQPGDKVTVIDLITLPNNLKTTVVEYNKEEGIVLVLSCPPLLVNESRVYHGHNVQVEVKGEEMPERLMVEWVEVDIFEPHYNEEHGGIDYVEIKMPAHIAKQYLEWMEDNNG